MDQLLFTMKYFFVFALLATLLLSADAAPSLSGNVRFDPFSALLAAKGKATLLAGLGIGSGAALAGAGVAAGAGGRGPTIINNVVRTSNTRFK